VSLLEGIGAAIPTRVGTCVGLLVDACDVARLAVSYGLLS
jgi:hypothetical protein